MASVGINLAIGLGASLLLSLLEPPQKIEGPRLSDLSAPKSSYGAGIPIIWGKARVGGNLIWATKLREAVKKKKKRGKGIGPKVQETTYSYFANFAVMLCRGPIVRINRIWLNGKLVYAFGGSGNDFFNSYGRIYLGTTAQTPDPMIESTQPVVHNDYGLSSDPSTRAQEIATIQETYGIGITNQQPAYRGRAYIVFENFPLADYNNAIPTVSAEIIANESISLQAVIEELCDEAGMAAGEYDASDLADIAINGFVIKNIQSINSALEQLQQAYFFDVIRSQGVLKFVKQSRSRSLLVPDSSLQASHLYGQERPDDFSKEVITIEQLPSEVNVTFLDPAEDYAENTASYRRQRAIPDNKKDVSVQLVLTIDQAKQMAERLLFLDWIEQRIKYELTYPPALLNAEAGDLLQVTIAGQTETLEIRRSQIGANLLCEYDCTVSDKSYLNYTRVLPVEPVESEITVEGDTILEVFDIGLVSDGDNEGLYYTGTGEGTWRFGFLYSSYDNATYDFVATIDTKGVIGSVYGRASSAGVVVGDPLRDALPYVLDMISTPIVQLLPGDTLFSVTDTQLDLGQNKALIGDEVIQFGNAIYLGDDRWQISRLRRGIRGTAQHTTGHGANEKFILFTGDDAAVQVLEGTVADIGRIFYFKGLNSFQTPDQVDAIVVPVVGNAYRPYPPSGVTIARDTNGDLIISWQRHVRRNGRWQDGGDVSIPSTETQCRIEIYNGLSLVETATVTGNAYTYTAAAQLADFGSLQNTLTLTLYQLNTEVSTGFKGYPFSGTIAVSRVLV